MMGDWTFLPEGDQQVSEIRRKVTRELGRFVSFPEQMESLLSKYDNRFPLAVCGSNYIITLQLNTGLLLAVNLDDRVAVPICIQPECIDYSVGRKSFTCERHKLYGTGELVVLYSDDVPGEVNKSSELLLAVDEYKRLYPVSIGETAYKNKEVAQSEKIATCLNFAARGLKATGFSAIRDLNTDVKAQLGELVGAVPLRVGSCEIKFCSTWWFRNVGELEWRRVCGIGECHCPGVRYSNYCLRHLDSDDLWKSHIRETICRVSRVENWENMTYSDMENFVEFLSGQAEEKLLFHPQFYVTTIEGDPVVVRKSNYFNLCHNFGKCNSIYSRSLKTCPKCNTFTVYSVVLAYLRPYDHFGIKMVPYQFGEKPDLKARVLDYITGDFTKDDLEILHEEVVVNSRDTARSKCGEMFIILTMKQAFLGEDYSFFTVQVHLGGNMWRLALRTLTANSISFDTGALSLQQVNSGVNPENSHSPIIDLTTPSAGFGRSYVYVATSNDSERVYVGLVLSPDYTKFACYTKVSRYHLNALRDMSRYRMVLDSDKERGKGTVFAALNPNEHVIPTAMETCGIVSYAYVHEILGKGPRPVNANLSCSELSSRGFGQILKIIFHLSKRTLNVGTTNVEKWKGLYPVNRSPPDPKRRPLERKYARKDK